MKNTLLLLTITININCFAQPLDINKIDTSNYYDYNALHSGNQKYLKGKKLFENFLRQLEVTNIIYEELSKSQNTIQTNVLYKLDSNQYVNLDVYDLEKNIGFIYLGIVKGGGKEMRSIKSPYIESNNVEYMQIVRDTNGKMAEVNLIKKLPNNIKIIWADLYRYQYTEDKKDDKYLITKEIIAKILKQDVASFVNKLK